MAQCAWIGVNIYHLYGRFSLVVSLHNITVVDDTF